MIGRMPHAEHPLIAADGTHAASHLVGQRLKRQPLIRRRQRAGNGIAGAFSLLHREKIFNRLGKPAVQQVFEPFKRNQTALADARLVRQMKAVDGVKKKQCADALIKIIAVPAKIVEFGAGGGELLQGRGATNRVERPVPDL